MTKICPECQSNMELYDHGTQKQFLSWVCPKCGKIVKDPSIMPPPEESRMPERIMVQEADGTTNLPPVLTTATQPLAGALCPIHNIPYDRQGYCAECSRERMGQQ